MKISYHNKLVMFWEKHPEAKKPLEAWFRTMESKDFSSFNDLRKTFGSADCVDGLTVFDIGGDRHRLIASIHYHLKNVSIQAVLTRQEHGRGEWKQRR